MKQIELVSKRKRREKHYLQENGEIKAVLYDTDVHFKNNGKYEEIDNTLLLQSNKYVNKNNDYKVAFTTEDSNNLMKIKKSAHYINVKLKNIKNLKLIKGKQSSKLYDEVKYSNILKSIDLEYKVMPSKVKECIILKDKDADVNQLEFYLDTNLDLKLNADKSINASKSGKTIFNIDAPYMIDSNNKRNNNISYILEKHEKEYLLKLVVDKEWLMNPEVAYPVIIDPTITNGGNNNSVYDTYIYPNDTNDDRASKSYLKAGVERVNGSDIINRTLLKFELPTIGTGSQIINAELNLYGYPDFSSSYASDIVSIHRITSDWNEATANWNNMNNKYDSTRIEGAFDSSRVCYLNEDGTTRLTLNGAEITNLVKKWYTDTPNYGIMLKANTEVYTNEVIPMFFSKNNTVSGDNPKPFLSITYRNQNGLEEYMDYQTQTFSQGYVYSNNYNGNVTTNFNLGQTIGGKMPASLNLVYNTNDVVLNNNIGYGLGYRFSLAQTIEMVTIDGKKYLEYVDEDGTIHYFLNQKVKYDENNGYVTTTYENTYYDEDGLDLVIMNNDNDFTLIDKNKNTMKFIKKNGIGYLSEIKDVSGNTNIITYDNSNKIIKIVDANNQEININYENNKTSIISPDQTVTLNYLNNQVISIVGLLGTTSFSYDSNHILNSVTDVTGLKKVYQYYNETPYRLKKISEYGLNGTLGNSLDISYGFNSTTITDSKGHLKNLIFNNSGTIKSTSILKEKDDITNAYGLKEVNGETLNGVTTTTNKLLEKQVPIKYVKNILTNSSFETDNLNFSFVNNKVNLTFSTEEFTTGFRSLKAVNNEANQRFATTITLPKNSYYTFSAYIKNDNNIRMSLSYLEEFNHTEEIVGKVISNSNEFERHDITIYYPDTAISDLILMFYTDTPGTAYIDDIQLESGEVANSYNLLENSDFSKGLNGWTLTCSAHKTGKELSTDDKFEVVNINNQTKALKVKMNPAYNTTFSQQFNVCGKGGDLYNISFWYKNEGFNGVTGIGSSIYNNVIVNFHSVDEGDGHSVYPSESFNPNDNEWQYFSSSFLAEKDFDSITLTFMQTFMANNFYITNINLFKDVRTIKYDYDERGNIILSKDLNNQSNKFKYDDHNQLIKMENSQGKKIFYEYDNIITNRLLQSISETGISNEIKYDDFGNPIVTRIINRGISQNMKSGQYKIRFKGTNKFLRLINKEIKIGNDECGHDQWNLEKNEIDGKEYYKICHSIIENKYITVQNKQIILTDDSMEKSLFSLISNDNGSFLIKSKVENMYLNNENGILKLSELKENDPNYQFYFETDMHDLFMEKTVEYSDDGKFVNNIVDINLNKTNYITDSNTGLVTSITNPCGDTTYYNYNDKRQISSIAKLDKIVCYEYNSQNLLSKIIQNNRVYNFEYDDFLRESLIKIGNNITLISNVYEKNNGNLLSSIYGNNHEIKYNYDEFDRLKDLIKMDDTYHYKYGNNGDLIKIISNNDQIKYVYDLSKKLYLYQYNDLQIKYKYDNNDNIICKQHSLNQIEHNIDYVLNDDNIIITTKCDGNPINYDYDTLGRIISKSINNFTTNFEYVTYGKRTSMLVKTMSINGDKYLYKYNKLNNVTHIYHNGTLEHKYYYDKFNQLIKEDDILSNKTIYYDYDELGNLLAKKTYEFETHKHIFTDKYIYNNSEWPDQLTYFNNNLITYDNIGNPVRIGNNIHLTWINGRQLSKYIDSNNVIRYKYNQDGVRTKKIINEVETNYYVKDSIIIFEKTNDNILYYVRDGVDALVGFYYNNDLYYYLKNNQNDIIGILDSNYNIVAKYTYDSWGKIISITDENGIDVSNNNSHIANINPFRYRSYYYDKETGLYYLNSRYYNPLFGRFISPDSVINSNKDFLSHNLYIYCSNDPINNADLSGYGFFKNVMKSVNNFVKSVKKGIKKFVSSLTGSNKKSKSVAKGTPPKPKPKARFVAEGGLGFGFSSGAGSVEVGGYKDNGRGYSNNKTYTYTTNSLGVSVGINDKLSIGLSGEVQHIDHHLMKDGVDHSSMVVIPWQVIDCENTKKSILVGTKYKEWFGTSQDVFDDNIFIGIDIDLHIVVGGLLKLGFDLDMLGNDEPSYNGGFRK